MSVKLYSAKYLAWIVAGKINTSSHFGSGKIRIMFQAHEPNVFEQ